MINLIYAIPLLFLIIANGVLLGLVFGLWKQVEQLREEFYHISADTYSQCEKAINDHKFYSATHYYDFLNFLHRTWFLQEDINGRTYPAKYQWTLDEELRLLALKKQLDDECARRGLGTRSMNRLEGL